MEITHIVYYSTARPNLAEDDLSRILATARRENLKNEVTGFLIYRDNYFLQLLEGNEDHVAKTLDRIKKDLRHHSITVIGECKSGSRVMPNWGMALVDSKKMATSARSLIDLFDLGRGQNVFASKGALELVLRKFSKDAEAFAEK